MVLIDAKSNRPVDVTAGKLHIRLAESPAEVRAAQALRYRVFYETMGARPTPQMAAAGRDFDHFDEFCDHLLVFDRERGIGTEAVVGTYRLLRREGAERCGQFYSADEYDISALLALPNELLELGRSCIDIAYRTGSTMQLLWRGIADYVMSFGIDLMFGCASLPGVEPRQLTLPLSYLYHRHLAPLELRAKALPERYVAMDCLAAAAVDDKVARKLLPPLIKGYLRLGGFVGDGAVVDPQFGTTDVFVVVKTDWVTDKYYRHYTREEGGRPAARR
ncbi:MAG: GNAT family N-acetyltransferase [Kiloniellales bacterium]